MGKGSAKPKRTGFKLRRRTKRWLEWAGVVGAALIIGGIAYQSFASLPGTSVPSQGNDHVQAVTDLHSPYNSDPPTSGPHVGSIAPWGMG